MSKVYERWAKKGEKDDITAREYLELLEEHGKGDNALKELAETLKERTRTEGVKKTTFSHPASFDYVLRKLKDLGKRETGYSNRSLMITIAVIEFLNRHENNPQPTLHSSVRGIELPSSVRDNLTQEFLNEIRNLPEEMARRKLRKNAKFLAKAGIESVGNDRKKEGGEESVDKEASKGKQEWERYKPVMCDLVNAMKQGDVGKMRDALEELPPAKELPLAFRDYVRSAERRVEQERESEESQKELEGRRKGRDLEHLKRWKQREEGGEHSWLASSPEELYSDSFLKYKRAIARAKDLIKGDTDEEDINKARALLEDLTLKGAPNSEIERELRHLKEELGIK